MACVHELMEIISSWRYICKVLVQIKSSASFELVSLLSHLTSWTAEKYFTNMITYWYDRYLLQKSTFRVISFVYYYITEKFIVYLISFFFQINWRIFRCLIISLLPRRSWKCAGGRYVIQNLIKLFGKLVVCNAMSVLTSLNDYLIISVLYFHVVTPIL